MRSPYDVRFEWGPTGAAVLAPSSSCLVVVDVLSFSTSVTVASEAGTRVYPCAWRDEAAAGFARENRAELAVGRRGVSADRPWSLSPATLRRAPFTERLVLPSPNGSAICASAVGARVTVIAGCLRNASAVGRYLQEHGFLRGCYLPGGHGPPGPVTVIAAGERWPDGSLGPGLEDLPGAGAILAALRAPEGGAFSPETGLLSPEAEAARACFEGTVDVAAAVTGCASGRELTEGGFDEDVAIAVEIDACHLVPVLSDGAFIARRPDPHREQHRMTP